MKIKKLLFVFLALTTAYFNSAYSAGKLNDKEIQYLKQLRDKAQKSDLAYQILESLTTEVGPRMAGTEGDARAVKWAENKFEQLGFDKVWKEPVTFPSWQRGEEYAEILSPFPQRVFVTALGNSVGTGAEGVQIGRAHV